MHNSSSQIINWNEGDVHGQNARRMYEDWGKDPAPSYHHINQMLD